MNQAQTAEPKIIIACGLATFDPENDRTIADVLARADAAMYENKDLLKGVTA